ncbi:hypothetical protein CCR95_00650 [Thiocystis minor]|nr:hypothetical protein [Thiocystis minor]
MKFFGIIENRVVESDLQEQFGLDEGDRSRCDVSSGNASQGIRRAPPDAPMRLIVAYGARSLSDGRYRPYRPQMDSSGLLPAKIPAAASGRDQSLDLEAGLSCFLV